MPRWSRWQRESGVRVDFGVREPHGLAQRPGVGDFGSGAVSDVVADYEHLISEPDLRPVQIVESTWSDKMKGGRTFEERRGGKAPSGIPARR